MSNKKIHAVSAIIITIFVVAHLSNHVYSVFGADEHIRLMSLLRLVYRNAIVESTLTIAVAIQIISGYKLFLKKRKCAKNVSDRIQIWSGLYLASFLLIHLSATFIGRYILGLDTNYYFGVAGINTFPFYLFFIPYYALAIMSFFSHIAAIHYKKMKYHLLGVSPLLQAKAIIILGIVTTIMIFYGLTNRFHGVQIPADYKLMIGA